MLTRYNNPGETSYNNQLKELSYFITKWKALHKDDVNLGSVIQEVASEFNSHRKTISVGYIMHVLFPELVEPCRPPTYFPDLTSYYKVTSVFTAAQSTTGEYQLWFKPKLDGCCLQSSTVGPGISDSAGNMLFTGTNPNLSYFDEHALIACVLTVTYIGSQQYSKGYYNVGARYAQSYQYASGADPGRTNWTQSQIEDFSLSNSGRAIEGCRVIWFPRDQTDTDLYIPGSGDITGTQNASGAGSTNRRMLEWIINFSGLPLSTVEGNVLRVEMTKVYHGIAQSAYREVILPVADKNLVSSESSMEVAQQVFRTPELVRNTPNIAKSQEFKKGVWDTIVDKAKNVAQLILPTFAGAASDYFVKGSAPFAKAMTETLMGTSGYNGNNNGYPSNSMAIEYKN